MRPTNENTRTAGGQTWTLQKENNTEERENFLLKQTHFSVNNSMEKY
jgi:hypothetical protein